MSRTAVVTGASSGIGRALAVELAHRGWNLILVARRKDRLAVLAGEVGHRVVEVRACDLADRDERALLAEELAARRVDLLCNNAGFTTCGNLADADPGPEAAEVEVNVVAVHELTRAVLPGMLARRSGAILVTGSTAGMQPVPSAATYCATKAFANTFAEALHVELRGTGVSCTLLAPGPVTTEFTTVGGIPGLERHRWFSWAAPETVARAALDGVEAGARRVIPGRMAKAQAAAGHGLPRRLLFPLLRFVVLPRLRGART